MKHALILALLLCGLPVLAQQPSTRLFESLPPAPQSISDADTEDELGELVLLQGPTHRKLFEVRNDTKYLYTSNVLLLPDAGAFNSTQDFLTLETLGLNFTPQLADDLFSTVYVRHQWAFYSAHDENNFDAQSIGLQLAHPVKDWFNVYGGFSANRAYLTRVDGNEFFRMYDAQIGIWRDQPLCSHAALFFGYQFDWRPSSPSILTRADNAFFVGANVKILPKLSATVAGRFSVQEYLQDDRTDLNYLVSATIAYAFCDYARIEVFTDYQRNDSSLALRDYRVFDGGGGVNLSFRF